MLPDICSGMPETIIAPVSARAQEKSSEFKRDAWKFCERTKKPGVVFNPFPLFSDSSFSVEISTLVLIASYFRARVCSCNQIQEVVYLK